MEDKKGAFTKFALIRPSGGVTAEETALAFKQRVVIIPFPGDPRTVEASSIINACGGTTEGIIVDEVDESIDHLRKQFKIGSFLNSSLVLDL